METHRLIKEFSPLHSSRNDFNPRRGKLNSELAENLIYFLNGRSAGMRPNAVASICFRELSDSLKDFQEYQYNLLKNPFAQLVNISHIHT